jgi:hypothetical protein
LFRDIVDLGSCFQPVRRGRGKQILGKESLGGRPNPAPTVLGKQEDANL